MRYQKISSSLAFSIVHNHGCVITPPYRPPFEGGILRGEEGGGGLGFAQEKGEFLPPPPGGGGKVGPASSLEAGWTSQQPPPGQKYIDSICIWHSSHLEVPQGIFRVVFFSIGGAFSKPSQLFSRPTERGKTNLRPPKGWQQLYFGWTSPPLHLSEF